MLSIIHFIAELFLNSDKNNATYPMTLTAAYCVTPVTNTIKYHILIRYILLLIYVI